MQGSRNRRERIRLAVLGSVLLFLPSARGAEFRFEQQGCPPQPIQDDGEGVKTYQVEITLTSSELSGQEGAAGWTVAVEASGARIRSLTTEGLRLRTLHDEDGDPETPPVESEMDLNQAYSVKSGRGRYKEAVFTSIELHPEGRITLPEGTQTIARMTLEVSIPTPECQRVMLGWADTLFVEDGMVTTGVLSNGEKSVRFGDPCTTWVTSCVPSFTLSAVPEGEEPPASGDYLLEGTVAAGDHLLPVEVVLESEIDWPDVLGLDTWTLSILHDPACLQVEEATVNGLVVQTSYDDDFDPSTPPLDPYPHDLGKSSFRLVQPATGRWPSPLPHEALGVISAIVLTSPNTMFLHMGTREIILRILYRITAPPGETTDCRIAFVDGLVGQGQPVPNMVFFHDQSYIPETHGLVVLLRAPGFQSGDANADGSLDLSDSVYLLENLFLGGPRPSCRKTGDLDDNGAVEITDPIYLLNFLFLGGPAPIEKGVCRSDPTPDDLGCLAYPPCG